MKFNNIEIERDGVGIDLFWFVMRFDVMPLQVSRQHNSSMIIINSVHVTEH